MSDISLFEDATLRNLKSQLCKKLITKNNNVALLMKEIKKANDQNGDVYYAILEDQLASEEKLCNKLQRNKKHVQERILSRDLQEQIVDKEIEGAVNIAENCIESIALKAEDDNFYSNLKQRWNAKERQDVEDLAEFARQQSQYKELADEKQKLQKIINNKDVEHQNAMKSLHLGVQKQQSSHKKDMEDMVKCVLSARLREEMEGVEKKKVLVEEAEFWRKALIEKERKMEREKVEVKKKQDLEMSRAAQIREKLQSNEKQKSLDEEYRRLLCELFAAEAQSERLRDIDALARRAAHNMDAGFALRAHRRHKREVLLRELQMREEEQEMDAIRSSILEEEEKRILLENFPKLEPFLTPEIIKKLSQL